MSTKPAFASAAPADALHAGDIFGAFSKAYEREKQDSLSIQDYLEGCRDDPGMYASAPERMVAAVGEPKFLDTSADQHLGRIFLNRTIKIYPTMTGFFGMEDTIQRVVRNDKNLY